MKKNHDISCQDNSSVMGKASTSGVTLVALVVTIVVLLILAGITITYIMSDNSIFKQALDAKTQTEIERLRERIEVIQSDWWIDKKIDPTVTLDNFWERLIDDNIITSKDDVKGPEKEGENDIYLLDTTEGYIVEVIVTPDGNVIIGEIVKGDSLPPKVRSIQVTNKSSNGIEIKVAVSRLEEGKLSYYYKREDETTYHELSDKQNVTDLTATFTGLEQNKVYSIKVVAKNKKGTGEKTINVLTGELEVGSIRQKGETVWNNNKASIELETTNTNLILKYQINGIDGTWLDYEGSIGNLNHEDIVYAILTDGTNYGGTASIEIRDTINPTATISNLATSANTGANITATVTHQDNESGVKTAECKWVFTTSSTKLGTTASSYTGGTFSSNNQSITWSTTTAGTYYLHLLTVDNAGNKVETVSSAVTVNQLATGITVSPTTVSVEQGKTTQLTATVTPADTKNKSVTWTSSNTSVATVSSSGLVTGVKAGNATITVKTADGSNKSATCSVTVKEPAPTVDGSSSSHTATTIDYTWEQINKIAIAIASSSSVKRSTMEVTASVDGSTLKIGVGDIATVRYGGTNVRVRVLGFKHDDLVNTGAYGGNHSKASISFEFLDFMTGSTYKYMNSSNTNSGGWAATQMRKDLNGYSNSNATQSGAIGGLGANLNNKSYIKQVKKEYIATYNSASSVKVCNDYLWLLAASEIVNSGYQSGYAFAITSEGSQYKYYQGVKEEWNTSSKSRVKTYPSSAGDTNWWLRSPSYNGSGLFCGVYRNGNMGYWWNASYTDNGVAPGFCI